MATLSFRNFLEESARAPLYHGTTWDNFIAILEHGELWTPLSLSRNWHYSATFSKAKTDNPGLTDMDSVMAWFGFTEEPPAQKTKHAIVFEFDQDKLRHNYPVRPYNMVGDPERIHIPLGTSKEDAKNIIKTYTRNRGIKHSEAEDRVLSYKPVNVLKYVNAIYFSGSPQAFGQLCWIHSRKSGADIKAIVKPYWHLIKFNRRWKEQEV